MSARKRSMRLRERVLINSTNIAGRNEQLHRAEQLDRHGVNRKGRKDFLHVIGSGAGSGNGGATGPSGP